LNVNELWLGVAVFKTRDNFVCIMYHPNIHQKIGWRDQMMLVSIKVWKMII
jgi:hypothetical protein